MERLDYERGNLTRSQYIRALIDLNGPLDDEPQPPRPETYETIKTSPVRQIVEVVQTCPPHDWEKPVKTPYMRGGNPLFEKTCRRCGFARRDT